MRTIWVWASSVPASDTNPELQPFGPLENSRNFVGNIHIVGKLIKFCKGPHSDNYLGGLESTEIYTVYTVFNFENAIFDN